MPVRALTQRFSFVFLVLAAFGLMLLGRAEPRIYESIRTGVVDVVTPIMDVLSRPAASLADLIDGGRRLLALHSENQRLTEENARLREWQHVARQLAAENKALRDSLNFVPERHVRFVSGRVIADAGGVFVQSRLVNAGRRHGVRRNSAVMTGAGLAGRIASVGKQSSRVLLITDLNSRIPVLVESSRERAILAGDNRNRPKLVFLRPTATIREGDRIVTSGTGGLLPPGLPVGRVATVDKRALRVEPYVELDRLEYVRIVDYPSPALSDVVQAAH